MPSVAWHDLAHRPDCCCEDCRPVHLRGDVERWRAHELLEAGYLEGDAEKIASTRVDLHEAVELVTVKGCPPATAAKIIL